MGDRPWGASSSIRALKTSSQSRNCGSPSGVPVDRRLNRDQKRRHNSFTVLADLDADEYEKVFPSLAGARGAGEPRSFSRVLSPSGKSPVLVFRDAVNLRLELLDMIRNKSLDSQGQRALLTTVKKLDYDEKLAKGPPLDSAKLAKLEARILRLNKIKASIAREVANPKQDYPRSSIDEGATSVVASTEQGLPSILEGGVTSGGTASKDASKNVVSDPNLVGSLSEVRKDEVGPDREKKLAETQERVLATKNDLKKDAVYGAPAETITEEEEGDERDGEGEADSKCVESSDLESEDDEEEEGDESVGEINQAGDLCVAKSEDEAVGTTVEVTSVDVCVVSLENLVHYGEDYHRGDRQKDESTGEHKVLDEMSKQVDVAVSESLCPVPVCVISGETRVPDQALVPDDMTKQAGVSNVQVGVYEKQDAFRVLDGCSQPNISLPDAVADHFVVKLRNALIQDCLEGEKEKQGGESKNVNAHGRHPLDERPRRSWANIAGSPKPWAPRLNQR
ncbi:hypothetical protein U1Q18_029335, partial [Sarracenia purpurea var. burkii]